MGDEDQTRNIRRGNKSSIPYFHNLQNRSGKMYVKHCLICVSLGDVGGDGLSVLMEQTTLLDRLVEMR